MILWNEELLKQVMFLNLVKDFHFWDDDQTFDR